MGVDPATGQSEKALQGAVWSRDVRARVSVRTSACETEAEVRVQAQRCLPGGWCLGEVIRHAADGDEVVFDFEVATG